MSLVEQGVRGPQQAAERTFPVRVERKEELAVGVVRLTLVSPQGHDLPAWQAGAHIDLLLDDGLVRQYSLCGDPADRRSFQVAVLREEAGQGGSAFIHDRVAVGDSIDVRGPRNHFGLIEADEYLFIAGGIGVTPIVPMIATVSSAGRPWRFVYGGRSRASMAYVDELRSRYAGAVEVRPQDETGLLPLDAILSGTDDRVAVYCCGPEALLSAVEAECERQSIARLRVERFAPKPLVGDHPDTAFEIELARTGQTFTVREDESILDVIEEAGIPVDSSCRDGTCATCETGILEGVADHRDSILSPAEQEAGETMMICVSRCKGSKLVLDL